MDLAAIASSLTTEGLDASVQHVDGWGLSTRSESLVAKPQSAEEVRRLFSFANEKGMSLGFRGSGCSYGDASQNKDGLLLDLTQFAKIKSFDEESGLLVADPGVTLEMIWRHCVPLGWWPPVVSGTMYPTLGGLLSMNVHGKNNWQVGTIGAHVQSFRLMTVEGEELVCDREQNSDVFHAAIGGFGMLGCFTEVRLQLKKLYSGRLEVEAISTPNLGEMIAYFETHKDDFDYLVGWVDCFPRGKALGRGLIHAARYLDEGEDERAQETMRVAAQDLPSRILGVVPKNKVWYGMRPMLNDWGMRAINAAKYWSGTFGQTRNKPYKQAHAAFAFLLDYVPDWKKAYGRGGLIQYQTFVPKEAAGRLHPALIDKCHKRGIVPYLGVYKRHRPDPFLLTHAVDGFSFAMDFRVTESNRTDLWRLCHEMDEMLVEAGGRLYFAKDATMMPRTAASIWGREAIEQFTEIKRRLDPETQLQTNLARRVFPDWFAGAESNA